MSYCHRRCVTWKIASTKLLKEHNNAQDQKQKSLCLDSNSSLHVFSINVSRNCNVGRWNIPNRFFAVDFFLNTVLAIKYLKIIWISLAANLLSHRHFFVLSNEERFRETLKWYKWVKKVLIYFFYFSLWTSFRMFQHLSSFNEKEMFGKKINSK